MKRLDLREFINPGDLVFDVGAHTGFKTIEYLKLGAKVVCFEPNYIAAIELFQKFGGNPNVFIEVMGLYDKETALKFHPGILTAESTFSEIVFGGRQGIWNSPKLVHVSTLGRMFEVWGKPAFIKIDTEGFETFVISGMPTAVPALSFEFNPNPPYDESYEACVGMLVNMGYTNFNYVVNYTVDGVGIESDEYRFDNWVDYKTVLVGLHEEPRQPGMNWGDVYAKT